MKHIIILFAFVFIAACSVAPTEKSVEQELFTKPRLCEPNNIFLIPKTDLPRLDTIVIPDNPTKEDLAAIILLQQSWIKEARKALYGF